MRAFQPLRPGRSTDPETLFPPSFGGVPRSLPGVSPVCRTESALARNGGVPVCPILCTPFLPGRNGFRLLPAKGILFRPAFCFAAGFCPVVLFLQALDAPRLLLGEPDKFDGSSAPFRDAAADLAVRQMGGIFARISRRAAGFVQYFSFWTSRSLRYSSRLGALCSRAVRPDVPCLLLVLRRCTVLDKRTRPLTCPFENPVRNITANRASAGVCRTGLTRCAK